MDDAQAHFEALQAKLVPLWQSIREMNDDEQTIVVIPSINVDELEGSMVAMQPYEERYLFLLLLLRQPRARVIYVTSQPILPSIVEYYLDLLPGVIPSHARPRLFTVPVLDGTSRPLSAKLLERPRLLERIRALIPDADRAHLVPFNVTEMERDLAVRLGIPMYGPDPRHFPLGTKTGGRRLFAEEGIRHPLGVEGLTCVDDAVAAIAGLRSREPALAHVLVKLNEGVAGEGNALVDLTDLPVPGADGEHDAIRHAVEAMQLELSSASFDVFVAHLEEHGGVAEQRIVGEEVRSPSVQLRVTPLGEVEVLSTHDQLLGGPSGQSYLGCVFPASSEYAAAITEEASKIAQRLANEGVIGRFAVDFVVVRTADGGWDAYAIEINLRKGGTTHPFLTLQFLTDGTYDAETATFTAPSGERKCFVATDHQASPDYRGLTPDDLFDIAVRHGLHFDQSRQTGVVFHMMTQLTESGYLGMTAVANSPEDARELYDRAVAVLENEARDAMTDV
jgi:hypothetical protein